MSELVNGRVVQPTPEQLREQYPNSPALWASLAPTPDLSADPRRREMQVRYPRSESMWPPERDLVKVYDDLEAEVARVAKMYPNSAPDMVAPMINHARNVVQQEMWEAELDQRRAADQAEREAAAPVASGE